MSKIDVAGLKVDNVIKQELLASLTDRLQKNQKTFVITPYSEFLFHSLRDNAILEIFNKADFSVPDGIGIFWAAKFLEIPLTVKNHYLKIFQAFWQMIYSGAAILLYPKFIRSAFTEKIPGSDLVWDLAELAAKNNLSIYLLGGFGDTPEIVAEKLSKKINGTRLYGRQNMSRLSIAGFSNKNADDPTVIDDIKKAAPDIIFVAYGPIKQERWIVENMHNLPAKLYIGLGGTFDYIAGKRLNPPKFVRSMGLEWLYRLITQPYRLKRIFNAVIGLITALLRYKVFMSEPYRPNVVSVVLNEKKSNIFRKV